MLSFKIHHQGNDTLLAFADKNIVGKTFFGKNLKIIISEDFYGNEEADINQIAKIASNATIINAIGHEATSALIKLGLAMPENVRNVCGLPHAQIVVIT